MTTAELKFMIARGMGRAALVLSPDSPKAHKQAVLDACLTDERECNWTEDGRAPYLMNLLDRTELYEAVLAKLIEPIPADLHPNDLRQRAELLSIFAKRGDERALLCLIRLAEPDQIDIVWALAHAGSKGIEHVAQNLLPQIEESKLYWCEVWLADLPDLSDSVRTLLKVGEKKYAKWLKANPRKQDEPKVTEFNLKEIRETDVQLGKLRLIAETLTKEQSDEAFNAWLDETDRQVARRLIKILRHSRHPLPLEMIKERADDGKYPLLFDIFLSHINHPVAREIGLSLLSNGSLEEGILCLERSSKPDDVAVICAAIASYVPGADSDDHTIHMCLRAICKMLVPEERKDLLIWSYENSPCSFCRYVVAKLLIGDGTLPDSYIPELEFDADTETQALWRGLQETPQTT